ncbi:MAG: PH domain-containing protein [Candidatus Taylorbacteria bacterium]|nr:PH domain-containing protein [Candidatus Taylorbacteria bacterium]
MIKVGKEHHLGIRTLLFMFLQRLTPAFFLLLIAFVLFVTRDTLFQGFASSVNEVWQINSPISFEGFIQIIALLAVIIVCLGVIIAYLQYYFFTFTLAEFDLRLQKGILTIEKVSIPYRQIQDVDVTRNIIYRIFGVSRLVVMSAGHEDPMDKDADRTIFDPIDSRIAEDIRLLLERRIGVQVIEGEEAADKEERLAMKGKGDEYKVID